MLGLNQERPGVGLGPGAEKRAEGLASGQEAGRDIIGREKGHRPFKQGQVALTGIGEHTGHAESKSRPKQVGREIGARAESDDGTISTDSSTLEMIDNLGPNGRSEDGRVQGHLGDPKQTDASAGPGQIPSGLAILHDQERLSILDILSQCWPGEESEIVGPSLLQIHKK